MLCSASLCRTVLHLLPSRAGVSTYITSGARFSALGPRAWHEPFLRIGEDMVSIGHGKKQKFGATSLELYKRSLVERKSKY